MPARKRSTFGQVRRLPSGRYQARYTQPGTEKWVNGPFTFDTRTDGLAWLSAQRADLVRGAWMPPDSAVTLTEYANLWLEQRELKPRTRHDYRELLDRFILPKLGATPVRRLSPATVRAWYAVTATGTPTTRAHVYGLLRTVLQSAVDEELLPANPARIRGASVVKRASKTTLPTLEELDAVIAALPERYRLMALLGAWAGLRFGEATELRGRDIDTKNGTITISRAVTRIGTEPIVGAPKSSAGVRTFTLPPHILPPLREHLLRYGIGKDRLLFPAAHDPDKHLAPSSLARVWHAAREKAGQPTLRYHDLRHLNATLTARTGATT